MLAQLQRTIRDEALLERGDRVLVGLSGGPDSTALLVALVELGDRLGISVAAACVDHGLRSGSRDEALRVTMRARGMGVACEVLTVDVGAARGPHVSLQDAARTVRLAALQGHAEAVAARKIALGHTADDQAETVLFRAVRGTGVAGLVGIPYRRGAFVRPMLDVRRADVLRFLARRKRDYETDPSNGDARFARVRMRERWLPALAEENPRIVDALLRLSRDARRVIGGQTRATSQLRHADAVDRLVRAGEGTKRVSVAGGEVEVSYGQARWVAPTSGARSRSMVRVAGPGLYRVCNDPASPGLRLDVHEAPVGDGAVAFDLAALEPDDLVVRPPRPGDRMRLRGGRGSRKLAELLVDAKVPRPVRAVWPVLACGDAILYAPGLRPSEVARPGPDARRLLVVRPLTETGPFIDQTRSADNTF